MNWHPRHLYRSIKALGHRLYQRLNMDAWFPHVPIALAVGLSGLLQINQTVHLLRDFFALPQETLTQLTGGLSTLAIRGVPHDVIGIVLLIMSMGLLLRSRLAWMVTVLMSLASLILELTPFASQPMALIGFHALVLLLLLSNRGHFQSASLATGTLFSITGIVLTLGFGVVGAYVLGEQFKPIIPDFPTALYFTIVTMSTVGYGDIIPITTQARLFTISLIILGLLVFATSLTAILGPMMNQQIMKLIQPRKKTMLRKDHIIVVGCNPLARNAAKAIEARGLVVTIIWRSQRPECTEVPADLIIGDASDSEILKQAQADTARAILALTDDDSDNAFIILAAKDVNEKIKTVVAVSDAHNMKKIKRVKPDVVLALPLIGAELLAMALSGEEMKVDTLFEQLLTLD
ncbi:MAG: NAD-binding protein [Halothiobacillaceae bacterium]|nr:NAD-binding protein [Halothiobacillaceae bacterium]